MVKAYRVYKAITLIIFISLATASCVKITGSPEAAATSLTSTPSARPLPTLAPATLTPTLTPTSTPVPTPEPPITKHTYPRMAGALPNPERGFYTPFELPGTVGFSSIPLAGTTLVHLNIHLDEWREVDIPLDVLERLQYDFTGLRVTGLKAIVRFMYNRGSYPDSDPDAPKSWILRHIEQLQPLLHNNGAVIAWVEAGFIGAWGEWHSSTNNLDNLRDKREILNALLAALPENRMVQVRVPGDIIAMYPNPQDAAAARVGHHNDCFLSSDTDYGTYEQNGVNTMALDQAYLAELTRFTPMSGETCAPNPPRSECDSAIREMELLHFSSLNKAYHKEVIKSWETGGCLDEITNRLGYRLTLLEASYNEQVRPGGLFNLAVSLENSGFAAPVNPRPVYLVLSLDSDAGQATVEVVYTIPLDIQPNTWQPGEVAFNLQLRLPSTILEGSYSIALWLPDEASALHDDPRYAIRLANEGTWEAATGLNNLGTLRVDMAAIGSSIEGDVFEVIELK